MEKVVIIISLICLIGMIYPYNLTNNLTYLKENINSPWKSSLFVEQKQDYYFFNPDNTHKWIEELNINYNIEDEKTRKLLKSAFIKFKKAEEDKEYCNNLLGFNKDNTAYLKIKWGVLRFASQNTLKEIYYSDANKFLRKYGELYVDKEIKKKKKGNKTYTYEYFFTRTNQRQIEKITIDMIKSDSFYIGLVALSLRDPELGFELYDIRKSWESCVDYSKDMEYGFYYLENAFSYTAKTSNEIGRELYKNYKMMNYYGFCDEEYNDYGKEVCEKENTLLYSMENGFKNEFNEEKEYLKEYENGNLNATMNYFYSFLNFKREVLNLLNNSKEIERKVKEELPFLLNIIKEKNKKVKEDIEILDKEKINYIKISYYEGSIIQNINSIASEYNDERMEENEINEEISKTKEEVELKEKGWLAYSYMYSKEILRKQENLLNKIRKTKNKAKNSVENIRVECLNLIKKADSQGINVAVEKEMWEQGEKEQILGDKYKIYEEVWKRLIIKISMDKEGIYYQYNLLIKEIPELIKNAEKDNIDVSDEKNLFEIYRGIENKSLALNNLLTLKNNIISKARTQYSDLQDMREDIENYIFNSKGKLKDVENEMRMLEKGVVFNGIINYEKGIGRLRELEEGYKEILEKIEKIKEKIAPIEIYSNYNTNILREEPTEISGVITLYNNNPFELKNKEVIFYLPINLEEIEGIKIVEYKNCFAKIKINIKPYETIILHINKKITPIKITKSIDKRYGQDGVAHIEESMSLKANMCGKGIMLKQKYDKISGEGLTFFGGKYLKGEIKPGYYYLEGRRTKERAYEIERGKIKIDGNKERYRITIKPHYKFDYILLKLEKGVTIETEKRFRIERGFVKIYDVDEEVEINITKNISESDEPNKLLEELKLIPANQEELEEANKILDSNISQKQKIIKLEEILEKAKDRITKQRKVKKYKLELIDKISKERKIIEEGINCSINDSNLSYFKNFYEARKKYLDEIYEKIKNTINADEIYAINKEYDEDWIKERHKSIVSNIMKDFSKEYKKYNKQGVRKKEIEKIASNIEELFSLYSINNKDAKNICLLLKEENKLKKKIEDFILNKEEEKNNNKKELENSIDNVEKELDEYEINYNTIEFKNGKKPENIRKEINKIKYDIAKGKINEKLYNEKIKNIERKIKNHMESMKSLAYNTYYEARNVYDLNKQNIKKEEREIIEKAFEEVKDKIKNKKYGEAIRISKNIIANSTPRKSKNSIKNIFILIILGVSLLSLYLKDFLKELIIKDKKIKKKNKLKRIREEEDEDS